MLRQGDGNSEGRVGCPDASCRDRRRVARRALWLDSALVAATLLTPHQKLPSTLLSPWLVDARINKFGGPEHLCKSWLFPRIPRSETPITVLDVGANNGQFELWVGRSGQHAIGFEPSPTTCAKANARIARERGNWTSGGVAGVRCAAVGEASGALQLDEAHSAGSASFNIVRKQRSELSPVHASPTSPTVSVRSTRLDDEVPPDTRNILLKTDTQGYEMQVLRGATGLLKRGAVRLVMVEVSSGLLRNQGTTPLELMRFLAANSFDCTYMQFFTSKKPGDWRPVPLPPLLRRSPTVTFEEFDELLHHMPPYYRNASTDLVCWSIAARTVIPDVVAGSGSSLVGMNNLISLLSGQIVDLQTRLKKAGIS